MYFSVVSDPEQLLIFFKFLKFGRCAHDESLIGNEPLCRSRLIYISVVSDPEQLIIFSSISKNSFLFYYINQYFSSFYISIVKLQFLEYVTMLNVVIY